MTNLLVLPGLGSLMARRKVAGYLQIFLSLTGFLVTFVALVKIAMAWAREFILPDEPNLYFSLILGIVVFLAAWFWSLLTSLSLFRRKP